MRRRAKFHSLLRKRHSFSARGKHDAASSQPIRCRERNRAKATSALQIASPDTCRHENIGDFPRVPALVPDRLLRACRASRLFPQRVREPTQMAEPGGPCRYRGAAVAGLLGGAFYKPVLDLGRAVPAGCGAGGGKASGFARSPACPPWPHYPRVRRQGLVSADRAVWQKRPGVAPGPRDSTGGSDSAARR